VLRKQHQSGINFTIVCRVAGNFVTKLCGWIVGFSAFLFESMILYLDIAGGQA